VVLWGTVAKQLEHSVCSVEGAGLSLCVGSLSNSFTGNCSASLMFGCMVVYTLLNSRRREISNAVVLYCVVNRLDLRFDCVVVILWSFCCCRHFCLFYTIQIHIGDASEKLLVSSLAVSQCLAMLRQNLQNSRVSFRMIKPKLR